MGLQNIQIQDLIQAQLYESEEEVMQEALRHLLLDRPDLRIQVAIHRYHADPELSLAQAAAIAGVSFERMKELLEQHGVSLRLGPASIEDAKAEVATLEAWFDADSD